MKFEYNKEKNQNEDIKMSCDIEKGSPDAKRRKVELSLSENEESSPAYLDHDSNDLHEQLRHFDVLDEVQCDDSGSDDYRGLNLSKL